MSKPIGKINVPLRVYETSEGEVLELRPIRALIVERLVNSESGKPKVPVVEVTIGGKQKRMEENPGDPDYLAAVSKWEQKKNFALAYFLFTSGVKGSPPKEFVDEYRPHFPDADEVMMKYLWVTSIIPDHEIDTAMEAIMGQTDVTGKGLEIAADSFQGEGERQPD